MKSILISIKPEEVKKILNGEMVIETRNTAPKCELPCKVYIYCTNGYILYDIRNGNYPEVERKCTLDYTRKSNKYLSGTPPMLNRKVVAYFILNKIEKYIFENKVRYVWYIEGLKIYDNPKELSEFRKDLDCDDYPCNKGGKNSDCEYCYYDYSEGCQACRIDFDGEHCIYKIIKRPPANYIFVESLEGE